MATLASADIPQALADEVTSESVTALMLSRAPSFLPEGSLDHTLLAQTALGVAREVASLAGTEPDTQRWHLAVRAVTLGTARDVEAATFPVQTGLDETGLLRSLERRYASVMAQLDGQFSDDAVDQREPGDPPAPRGSFPPPQCYPDPARW